ncbi:glycerophosphodiester phosphodiesterase family protein, partial [Paraeggerthella hominis]|uniref:glycerophosphodiester phosphodiesterase family protein n=1 Tax=Paraeggerthella hominis TaxID=2897351 RepID=UPI003D0D7154
SQQTADGVLMVMHDANLKRTTGLDKNFWEVTYNEIKDLDNGSWFDPAFADQRVCTLEEALALCKGKIKMNIEVKPDGHGTDLERKTVDLINAYGMRDHVAVASISYDALVRVKQADPLMPTMYDMTLAYGYLSHIPYVDYFSVDDFFVTQQLVDDAHREGKIVYAWTVNDPANMARLLSYGIDGLVTDDVTAAREMAEDFHPAD